MALADRLSKAPSSAAGLPCKVGTLLEVNILTDEDKEALRKVLDVPVGGQGRLPNTAIAAALREEGYDVGDSAVNKHRRKACRCYGTSPKFGATA